MDNKKLSWKLVLGLLIMVSACVVAYNITKEPEQNVRLPIARIYQA